MPRDHGDGDAGHGSVMLVGVLDDKAHVARGFDALDDRLEVFRLAAIAEGEWPEGRPEG